jgi:hypothetical protein
LPADKCRKSPAKPQETGALLRTQAAALRGAYLLSVASMPELVVPVVTVTTEAWYRAALWRHHWVW